MPFRFVHTADLHLDSPLRSLALRHGDLAELVGQATRRALVAIVDLCLAEQVQALVIAGDLYDGDQTSMKTARFLAGEMERLHRAGVPVFIIRGNHDALSKITRELVLPPSVKVFGARADTVELSHGGLDLALHGLSFSNSHAPESLLPKYRRPVPDAVNIGIMHTSLDGAPGHKAYAPCALADLQRSGFDYWALGHIHARADYAGATRIVMPGMPQGRDINEAGPKSVSLVTLRDDRSVEIEARLTGMAQFERIPVDLTGVDSWREVVDTIERAVAATRGRVEAEHLICRLMVGGDTALSWRVRRDRDLLLQDARQRIEGDGRAWIEKIEIALPAQSVGRTGPAADPMSELHAMMAADIGRRPATREAVRGLVRDLMDDLPAEARRFSGESEADFEAYLDRLLVESCEYTMARLRPSESGAG